MVGLESAVSVVQKTLVEEGHLSWTDVARVLSVAPAAIGRVDGYGAPLAVGSAANITLVDATHRGAWSVDRLRGGSTNTPYRGLELPGRVMATLFNGRETVVDGELVDPEIVRNS